MKTRYTMDMAQRWIFGLGVFLLMASPVQAASLIVDAPVGPFGPAETFVATIRLDNDTECLNAVHVALGFPQDVLRAVDFSKGNSILSLWVEEPLLDNERGLITFSGGIPGGYCGRIQGDPALSNVLGKIVFTVAAEKTTSAPLTVLTQSRAYLHDGTGTAIEVTPHHAIVPIVSTPTGAPNAWIEEVDMDTVPPDAFTVEVQTTHGVFAGRYYLVFATQDKQSGVDHYEYFDNGAWKVVTSPHQLKGPFNLKEVRVRAIDKAGNERVAQSDQTELPRRPLLLEDLIPILEVLGIIMVCVALVWVFRYRRVRTTQV